MGSKYDDRKGQVTTIPRKTEQATADCQNHGIKLDIFTEDVMERPTETFVDDQLPKHSSQIAAERVIRKGARKKDAPRY